MKYLTHLLFVAVAAVALSVSAIPLRAHPHVWIDSRTDIVFDDHGMVIAINHEWTMDEMYTSMAIDGLDTNHDGIYSPEELEPLTKENIDSLKDFGYFTRLKANGKDVALSPPVEAGQLVVNKQAKLHFQLPLKAPLDPRKNQIVLKVYDPEFFIDIEFPAKDAVTAVGGIDPLCHVELQEANSDQQTNDTKTMLATKGVDWKPDPGEDFGSMFAQPIVVLCKSAPAAASAPGITVVAETAAPAPSQNSQFSQRALVPQRMAGGQIVVPPFFSNPTANILARQRIFSEELSSALKQLKQGNSLHAVFALMLLSFGYGVIHAAGPGHGKLVISGWLLATEEQLRRGILVAFASSLVQALSAILIVSSVLLVLHAAGTAARPIASFFERASFAMIVVFGLYLVWQALSHLFFARPLSANRHVKVHGHHVGHSHSMHSHHQPGQEEFDHHNHDHHDHSRGHHDHHGEEDTCNHQHLPTAAEVSRNWSLAKALSLSFAVGVRPCTGALLVLLFANALGLYWAGVSATFVMSLGTAITVSTIAVLAVASKSLAMRFAAGNSRWVNWTAFGLRLGAGLAIIFLGATLLVASLNGTIGGA